MKQVLTLVLAELLVSCATSPKLEDVALMDLAVRHDLVILKKASQPFTGRLLVSWPDGQGKCTAVFEDGVITGGVEFWTINKTTTNSPVQGYIQELISYQGSHFPHVYTAKPISMTCNNLTRAPKIGITFEIMEGYSKGLKFATATFSSPSLATRFNDLVENARPVSVALKADVLAMEMYYHRDVQAVRWEEIDPTVWKEEGPEQGASVVREPRGGSRAPQP